MSQITQEQITNKYFEIRHDLLTKTYGHIESQVMFLLKIIAELQLKVEALEKETVESDEEAFEKYMQGVNNAEWDSDGSMLYDWKQMKQCWLASRQSK